MTRFASYIAKITPPSQEGIVPRPRLFSDLDAGRERQVVWVSASAGAGKTALVGSYLDHLDSSRQCIWYKMDAGDADPASFFFCLGLAFQQHLSLAPGSFPVLSPDQTQNHAIFGIHFFEHVFTLPGAPKLVVIDNYHEVPDDAAIHNLLANALANLPADTSFILISRGIPHPAFARLRVSKHLSVLNADSLRFNLQETEQIVNRVIPGPHGLAERVHKHTGGWAAGLVLMVEHQRLIGEGGTGSSVNTPQEIMDYLAAELFQHATPLHQDFLLRSSAFDGMTAGMAKELTGVENASEILASLSRKHFFSDLHLNDDPLYLYPPLFLEFLRRQATSRFGHAAFRDIVRCAAVITEQQGFLEQAVSLYIASGDWPGVALMFQTISSDMISQGRASQLIEWLEKVPGAELNHHPRLLYWLGIAELSLARCTGARPYLELALMALDKQSDGEGVYLSWAAVVDSFFLEMSDLYQLDEWITSLQRIQERYPVFPKTARLAVALSNFTAHVLRQSDREAVELSREQLDVVLDENDTSHILRAALVSSLHHIWSGDYHHNELLLKELRQKVEGAATSPPLTLLTLRMLEGTHFWLTADSGCCRAAAEEGMALAEQTGLTLWDNQYLACHVHAAIIDGDPAQTRVYLQRMKLNLTGAGSLNGFYYHLLSAWVDLLEDDSASAQGHLEAAEGPMISVGSRYYEGIWCLAMAEVKLRRKANEAALHFIERALSIGSKHDIKNLLFLSLLYQAQMLIASGRSDDGFDSLRAGMRLGREQNYVHFIWWIPRKIAALCALSLQHGIEVEYARMLIRRRGLFPDLPPVEVEQWPWDVSIYCLGKLEVRVGNVPVKMQKKPLELLKAIIALGGADVRHERVTDLLWPDADGDTAFGSFKITLYRLRRLLGEKSVHFKEGKVSLDSRRVWNDVAAFERMAQKASAPGEDRNDPQMAEKLAEQAISLYKGQFLVDDQEQGWLYPQREKLSRTFISVVSLLGERQIAAGAWDQAIATYRKGVEMEPLAELLNEGIIRAYSAAGYRGEAVRSYKSYKHALLNNLGISPAPRINQLIAAT
jgi:LuxR family transcriptional regulator, maltose regulon positive regulatory protein